MAIDKAMATLLREQGMGYAEIALTLGCSVDWCKRALPGVSKNKPEKVAIALAVDASLSKEGITNGELRKIIRTVYPYTKGKAGEDMEQKTTARFKAVIRKDAKAIIRPYWMRPNEARRSLKMILSSVDMINQRMTDEVECIRRELDLDESYDNSLRYAILKMVMGTGLAREGVENHCRVLEDIVDKLEEREGVE